MSARKAKQDDKAEFEMPDEIIAEELEVSDEAAILLAELKDELNKAVEARQRALADFANFQRRSSQNEQQGLRKCSLFVCFESPEINVLRSMFPDQCFPNYWVSNQCESCPHLR